MAAGVALTAASLGPLTFPGAGEAVLQTGALGSSSAVTSSDPERRSTNGSSVVERGTNGLVSASAGISPAGVEKSSSMAGVFVPPDELPGLGSSLWIVSRAGRFRSGCRSERESGEVELIGVGGVRLNPAGRGSSSGGVLSLPIPNEIRFDTTFGVGLIACSLICSSVSNLALFSFLRGAGIGWANV